VRVAIYARVSTANNGQDPTMQTRELREYAERRGWSVFAEYVDIGISGTKETRPELDRLMADTHRRRFDAVVVWKFDRFARSVSHLLRALETFRALGIEFVSFSEQLDTSTPAGQDGLYRPGRRGGARAWLDRRAGEGRASERQGERQAAWAPQDQRQSRSD
jgi:DNA invertase Pin-like site-specific DNA recombinase